MKKILFIPHTFSKGGGTEKVLSILINELNEKYLISIIERLECIKSIQIPENVIKLKSMSFSPEYNLQQKKDNCFLHLLQRRLLAILTYLFPTQVYQYYIKDSYDAEISFNYLYSSYLIAHSPNKTSKKIMWMHESVNDLDFSQYPGFKKVLYYFYKRMQYISFRNSDIIVATSKSTQNSILRIFPEFFHKVQIIYNGYDLQKIENESRLMDIKPTKKQYRLISAGRLDRNKNVLLQIDAIKILVDKKYDIELLILGDGDEKEKLSQRISDLKLKDNVQLCGFVPNQYAYIRAADVLLLSSIQEGFPTIVVEALSLGIPVVTTPVGGIDELIHYGINGYVANCTPKSFSREIENVLKKELNPLAVKESVKHLTKESWAKKVIDLIN